jgi:hypothetical protein
MGSVDAEKHGICRIDYDDPKIRWQLAADEELVLVPGHDPVVWPHLTAQLAAKGGRP